MITPLTNVSVLIADDYPINLVILNQLLTSGGATVATAQNGLEVLQKLKEGSFDIILMDLQMPEMDGFETAQNIRYSEQPYSNIPIVAVTGESNPTEIEKIMLAGMDDFLFKPVAPKALFEKILEQLEKREKKDAAIPEETIERGPEFNLTYLLEITGGRKDKLSELIENLAENGPSLIAQTAEAVAGKNWPLAAAHLHQLKGLIGIFYMRNMINNTIAMERELKLPLPDEEFMRAQLAQSQLDISANVNRIKSDLLG